MADKVKVGLIGVIAILAASLGGYITLTPTEFDNAYYCPLTEQVGIFHRLSASQKTGYYMYGDEEKSVACRSGNDYELWVSLREYAEEQGIPIQDFLQVGIEPETDYALVRGTQGIFQCEYKDGALWTYSKCYSGGVFKNYAGELICGP